ncbi:MAG TPA: transglutaminase family protein [Burkholderiaceae bacterium]|nr:transglutaminase family protein [Burkholderiaceae bacterium]HMX10771.1 transglutaminase family protein [Burkholderiaceae bacterium]HMY99529.1 transglutaminase family protein [Burkholderiaceae bacterium]HNB43036.1 transglutaminase family protein [Burkholderiaceae bacterium]HNG78486.1 transglutaminase family protein [Burkholderiaceae bacterium]
MKLHIVHRTVYRYRQPLRRVVQTLRLTPRSSSRQTVLDWAVQGSGSLHPDEDAWGNVAHLHTVDHGARRLSAEAAGVVETAAPPDWIDPLGPAPDWYREASTLVGRWPAIIDLALTCLPPGDWAHPLEPVRGIGRLLRLAEGVRHRVRYRPGSTDVHTTAEAAWRAGEGVCQDQAQVFIAACRAAGLPARYVSGYFLSHAAATVVPTGGATADAGADLASHAWAEVCIDVPQRRWLGVDVTHACLIDERHVIVAVGPDYAACPPVRGVRSGGGDEAMAVQLRITPL